MNEVQDRVDQLNKLVVVNNDRIHGYQKAAEETKDPDLKMLFDQYAQQSSRFKMELAEEIASLGGQVNEETSTSGDMYRTWMDVRQALSSNDKKAVLKSCEFGEDVALQSYEKVLNNGETFSPGCMVRVESQRSELRDAHDSIKSLRDAVS
ncbi:uncharacterized protein (TIGR02284 family) [Anseongella ginsenosidimutans]|uniref:Uncharacterized protein (TIGR02284 family) n=1 Tax=Anseongella ginsenosidimutans TaxID=496056 RepID=A0A4R3KQV8_9SPHI|nr:PA2169 family four-helix-bundle protein [Anseongella ginsenosidimutans]QEC52919.1 PA2169 family four-helix-bundle protein [Anseongella ginsenosidimutans]TCS87312.1 uncharacterized protein (TIGR02284 family) [Anseongella ginsenosidimutans]